MMQKLPDFKFTREGFDNLKKEEQELTVKRPQVLKRMVDAREQGDLSENAGYHAAKEELGKIDSRLKELKLMLRLAKVVDSPDTDKVGFGSVVIVENEGEKTEFKIVDPLEADPIQGKVSDSSPIGSGLVGKKVGDEAVIETPGGKIVFKVLEIK